MATTVMLLWQGLWLSLLGSYTALIVGFETVERVALV